MPMIVQRQLKGPGPLLNPDGTLADIGWARQPILDCNLENTHVYSPLFRFWQLMRIKRWDYYGITTPTHFFSFTVSDVGYLASIFAYVIEFATGIYHEETLTIPLAKGVSLPRNSTEGESIFNNGKVLLKFSVAGETRKISVNWPDFFNGSLKAEVEMSLPASHESMLIVIPIKGKRFYFNRKVNCIPVNGWVEFQGQRFLLQPKTCLANLDWGRGVWDYDSFWVWASASGFLPDKRSVGLNLGYGFGDTSEATENAVIVDGRLHKLAQVDFSYDNKNFKAPWRMKSPEGRLDLTFTPFFERVARLDLKLLASEVHQLFGRYNGTAVLDSGEKIKIENLIGWAEEHHAKW
jgi:hypothetical protein